MIQSTSLGRQQFLQILGAGAMSLALRGRESPAADVAAKRPNIIVIVADDLGYADLGCQGATDIRTPNVDSLAANGVRFTDGHVSCPVCSPTPRG